MQIMGTLLTVVGLIVIVTFGNSASAAGKKNPVPKAQTPTTIQTLTKAECEGLGGKVVDVLRSSKCTTGKMCYTTDKNGVIHHSCITKLQ
jgi:hypothetical protein